MAAWSWSIGQVGKGLNGDLILFVPSFACPVILFHNGIKDWEWFNEKSGGSFDTSFLPAGAVGGGGGDVE